jgi:hypothetical protein
MPLKCWCCPRRGRSATEFIEAVAEAMGARPSRSTYYPGSEERFEAVVGSGTDVRVLGERASGLVPPAIIEGIDPYGDSPAFRQESFCHVLATTLIEGDDPGDYLERAVAFCNDRLRGTLNATLLVDPATAKSLGGKVGRSVAALRYGCVGVNVWAAAGFALGVVPWGAYPGHPPEDIQSGTGFVHNARLVDRPEKTVITAPFHQVPKPPWSLFHRRSAKALRAATMFEANPSAARLAKVLAPALRP